MRLARFCARLEALAIDREGRALAVGGLPLAGSRSHKASNTRSAADVPDRWTTNIFLLRFQIDVTFFGL
jgi:hypothetical protein